MDAARREQIIEAYERHAQRFAEISAGRHHPTGLFPQYERDTAVQAGPHASSSEPPTATLPAPGRLSRRQHQVLSLIAAGFSNDEIGAKLDINVETVKSHVKLILQELRARNRAHAVSLGFQHRLFQCSCAIHETTLLKAHERLARSGHGTGPADLGGAGVVAPTSESAPAKAPNGERHAVARRKGGATPRATKRAVSDARAPRAALTATRLSELPVVVAGSVSGYGPIFNAGVIYHDGNYHLIARAVRNGYRPNPATGYGENRFLDYVSDLLAFTSPDGLDYRFQRVLRRSNADAIYEDPRVQAITSEGQTRFLLSYTRLSARAPGKPWRAAISELTYKDGAFSFGRELLLGPEDVPNKDVVLCNLEHERIAVIQRLEPATTPQQSIQLATFASLEELWETKPASWRRYMDRFSRQIMLTPGPGTLGIGAGAPPLLVDGDLVFFYHERDRTNAYTARVALLDNKSARVQALLPYPVLVPQLPWELTGDVDNVVFVQGAQLRDDSTIYLTYGAADRHVGAASIETKPLLAALRAARVEVRPRLRAAA